MIELSEERLEELSAAVVIGAALLLFLAFFTVANSLVFNLCGGGFQNCVPEPGSSTFLSVLSVLGLAVIRPFFFFPVAPMAIAGLQAFGLFWGGSLFTASLLIGAFVVYFPVRVLARRFVQPWVTANLPATSKFVMKKDYVFAMVLRFTPFIPFELASACMGALGFRYKTIVWTTVASAVFEAVVFYIFLKLFPGQHAENISEVMSGEVVGVLSAYGVISLLVLVPLLLVEVFGRSRGVSLIGLLKRSVLEIKTEVSRQNVVNYPLSFRGTADAGDSPDQESEMALSSSLAFDQKLSAGRTTVRPVLLFYGFFSSRRSIGVIYRELTSKGLPVVVLDLGGFLGFFNTHNIREIARRIDFEVANLKEEFGFSEVDIVAHSKGGLIALWWAFFLLRGNLSVHRVITMGTPFSGLWLAYLTSLTPLCLFARDGWQMRPNSKFLKSLRRAQLGENCKDMTIYCFNSKSDSVVRGKKGVFKPYGQDVRNRVVAIDSGVNHFSYLSSRRIARKISAFLIDGNLEDLKAPVE